MMSTINRTAKVRENGMLPVQKVEHIGANILLAIMLLSMSNQDVGFSLTKSKAKVFCHVHGGVAQAYACIFDRF